MAQDEKADVSVVTDPDSLTSAMLPANLSDITVKSNKIIKNARRYHPLRKLMNGDNPNAINKNILNFSPAFIEYLKNHNIEPKSFYLFATSVSGDVVTPFSSNYNISRQESDPSFDKFPLMVIYCTGTADVVKCIKFARNNNIKINARAGGHSTAGYSVLNGRMVIDVSNIKGIFISKKEQLGTVGSGITWGEFNYELDAYDLHAVGGSCSSVGCTGYTLGGGYGYTSMRWGICSDNLRGVEIVDNEGNILTANEFNDYKDLFWACRGGTGNNFGIVTSLTYQLHDLKMVWPIVIDYEIEYAAQVLYTWQQNYTKTLKDDKLGLLGFLATKTKEIISEDGKSRRIDLIPYFAFRGIYSGDNKEEGRLSMLKLLEIPHITYDKDYPLFGNKIDYSYLNEHLLDNVEGVIPDVSKEIKRCAYVNDPLTLEQYQKMVDYYKTTPSQYNIVSMEPYGGNINKMNKDATAFVHRDAYFDIFVDSFWMPNEDRNKEDKLAKIAKDWLDGYFEGEQMKDLWSEHYYQNYPYRDYKNWQNGYFGTNYPRLREIKTKYDKINFFNFPQSIEPLEENC